MAGVISVRFAVPWTLEGVRVVCGALTALNRLELSQARDRRQPYPNIYASGVRYAPQVHHDGGTMYERFETVPVVLRRGTADCDQLAAWRAAELQERGIMAMATPIWVLPRLMHVIVRYPDGSTEDPSKRLGMRG